MLPLPYQAGVDYETGLCIPYFFGSTSTILHKNLSFLNQNHSRFAAESSKGLVQDRFSEH